MLTPQTIAGELSCGQHGCTCGSRSGDGFKTHCPTHQDETPSLQVSERDGKILVKCFGGCSQEAVIEALRDRNLWHIPENSKKYRRIKPIGKARNSATPPGLTLEELANAKGFKLDGPKGLKAWGVAQQKYLGATVIRIPYFSADGQEVAVRYRKALGGENRFSWRKGDRVCLYGLGRKPREWTLMVEGETDCWTAWAHDLPAFGIPGKSTWRPEWAEHLRDMKVYLWQEPDAPELPAKIGKDLPDLMVIQAPNGFKDLNEAHV